MDSAAPDGRQALQRGAPVLAYPEGLVICASCGLGFVPVRRSARHCSHACQERLRRRRTLGQDGPESTLAYRLDTMVRPTELGRATLAALDAHLLALPAPDAAGRAFQLIVSRLGALENGMLALAAKVDKAAGR